MAVKILFAPHHPQPIMDVAMALKPPEFELLIHEHGTPEYYRAAEQAEYYCESGGEHTLVNGLSEEYWG
jgi:hypothetical protein